MALEGWFPTGDVGVMDAEGFIQLTDRTKDLIKSGGEWISSIALENIAVGHPDVAEAAAIATPDEKWGERPLVIVVPRVGHSPSPERTSGNSSPTRLPAGRSRDRVIVAEELPHGATGKISQDRIAPALRRAEDGVSAPYLRAPSATIEPGGRHLSPEGPIMAGAARSSPVLQPFTLTKP